MRRKLVWTDAVPSVTRNIYPTGPHKSLASDIPSAAHILSRRVCVGDHDSSGIWVLIKYPLPHICPTVCHTSREPRPTGRQKPPVPNAQETPTRIQISGTWVVFLVPRSPHTPSCRDLETPCECQDREQPSSSISGTTSTRLLFCLVLTPPLPPSLSPSQKPSGPLSCSGRV